MKNFRYIGWIKDYLKKMGRPCTTNEICDYLNTNTKYGIMIKSLGNILSRNSKYFVRVGSDSRGGCVSGVYNVGLWDLVKNIYNN